MAAPPPLLLAVPNVSEGADRAAIDALAAAFAPARLLDVHSDPDHGRSVFTLAARQGEVAAALASGAGEAARRIDLTRHAGSHPHVGALDVAPVVYLHEADRGAAVAEALTAAALIGDGAGLPVFLYGDLATGPDRRERAELRRGGVTGLVERGTAPDHGPHAIDPRRGGVTGLVERGTAPDHGPHAIDPRRGAVLVTARPPLVAFNVDLAIDDVQLARTIAADLREGGGGPPGVRAIGLALPHRGRAQVSLNVHDHRAAPLAELVARVAARAPVAELELVGLAPADALEGLPAEIPLRGFDPDRHVIENALRSAGL